MSSAPSDSPGFVVVDYVLFACVIAISIGIGIFHACAGGRQKTGLEYHLGNRNIQTFPLILSMLVTTQSSILMLGIPAETYLYGGVMLFSSFGFFLSYLIGARIVVPMLYPLKLTTVSEYYQLRYKGKAVRLFIATCMILLNGIYIGVVVMGQAVAMAGVTRIPSWASMLAVSVAAVLYTSIGGIKAVIWTDVFQCSIMLFGILSVIIKGTIDAGGAAYVWEVNTASDRLDIFNFDPDPLVQYTLWSLVIGGTCKLFFAVVKQSAIQRMSSCKTQKEATTVYLLSGPAFLLTMSLACGEGLVAYAYFTSKGCDPLESKQVPNPNQLLPYMVVDIFRNFPGMSGMFLAAVVSASLSSVSSSLASMSSITHEDFIKPHFPRLSDATVTRLSKCSVVVYGIVGLGISFMVAEFPGSVFKVASSMLSVFGVPVVGVYLYSIFFPSATQIGAILGGVVGTCLVFWINIGSAFNKKLQPAALQPAPTDQCWNVTQTNVTESVISDVIKVKERPEGLDALYSLSNYWFDAVGLLCLLLVAGIVSCVVGRPKMEDSDGRYLFSFGERTCPCLPKSVRRIACCGDKLEQKNCHEKVYTKANSDTENMSEHKDTISESTQL
ncbi:sodium-dependent multivitamin transporter-like isoform X1 [Mizuhopecten yessoensis]|uniref:sodium-dependent multivitamin transporter-like isoform X1 n=1 Tax=Mizuhopecten yessoensis TaxID=6573 RepID=UPI000B45E612|nr:sodium-dependent multivitamin transporter-like isoform X1 [Mizuhopecten yessoensis]